MKMENQVRGLLSFSVSSFTKQKTRPTLFYFALPMAKRKSILFVLVTFCFPTASGGHDAQIRPPCITGTCVEKVQTFRFLGGRRSNITATVKRATALPESSGGMTLTRVCWPLPGQPQRSCRPAYRSRATNIIRDPAHPGRHLPDLSPPGRRCRWARTRTSAICT